MGQSISALSLRSHKAYNSQVKIPGAGIITLGSKEEIGPNPAVVIMNPEDLNKYTLRSAPAAKSHIHPTYLRNALHRAYIELTVDRHVDYSTLNDLLFLADYLGSLTVISDIFEKLERTRDGTFYWTLFLTAANCHRPLLAKQALARGKKVLDSDPTGRTFRSLSGVRQYDDALRTAAGLDYGSGRLEGRLVHLKTEQAWRQLAERFGGLLAEPQV